MKFAKYVFRIAGVYGLLVILPLYFLEEKLGVDYPPVMNHPEYYYAFAGVTLVWQVLFFLIANNPVRYRPMMVMCVLEKLSLVPVFAILAPRGIFPPQWIILGAIDLTLGVLFLIAFIRTKQQGKQE